MALGFLNISHNFVDPSNFIICEWVRSTAPATPVVGYITGTGLGAQNNTYAAQAVYPAPFANNQLQVTQLPEVWFLVRFWRSSDGVAKDLLLLELAGNARTGAVYPINRYEYVVDRGYNNNSPVVTEGVWSDPVQNDIGIRDTRLAGQTYWVEERGTGSFLNAELTDRTDEGGGFDFNIDDKVMESGGVYVVYVISRVDLAGDDSGISGISGNSGIYIMTESEDYNPATMGGKTIVVQGSDPVITLSFANLAILADSNFRLQTHGGSQRNCVLQLDAGDTVNFRKDDVNKIILGEAEEIEIEIDGNVMYVINHNTGHDKLGQVSYGYKLMLNTLAGDGSLLAHADYPRVQELLDSLPAGTVVNETTWQTSSVEVDGQTVYANKGKWMSDGTNFRPPDLRNQMLKALATMIAGTVAGTYEHQRLLDHFHNIASNSGDGSGSNLSGAHSTGGNLGYDLNPASGTPNEFRTGVPRAHTSGSDISNATQKVNTNLLYSLIHI